MKKLSVLFLALGLAFSVNTYADCGKDCKCKEKCSGKECKDCKKSDAAETKHKCNSECHKNGKGHVPSHGEKGHVCTDACKK
jgi:hypothetical protein